MENLVGVIGTGKLVDLVTLFVNVPDRSLSQDSLQNYSCDTFAGGK